MTTLKEVVSLRFLTGIGERMSALSTSLKSIGISRSVTELSNSATLVAVTAELGSVQNESTEWRVAVIDLIQVAEIWSDKSVAAHVLAWTRSSLATN